MKHLLSSCSVLLLATAGCAVSPKAPLVPANASQPAEAAPRAASATAEAPQPALATAIAEGTADVATLPTACATEEGGTCEIDPDFAKRLCSSSFPDVALALFSKGTPWTHGYLTGNYDAWNASGGMSSRAHLAFDEEVLVLQRRVPRGGAIVVTGTGVSFDVLRWDGTCVSLSEGEMTMKRPPQAKFAAIPWRRLGEATRIALLAVPKVAASQKDVGKECVGGAGSAKAKCEKADHAFDRAIVEFVRGGGAMPAPARRAVNRRA